MTMPMTKYHFSIATCSAAAEQTFYFRLSSDTKICDAGKGAIWDKMDERNKEAKKKAVCPVTYLKG